MHYSALVLLPKPPGGEQKLHAQLTRLLAPYWEELEIATDEDGYSYNPDGKWDWWQLGGRWHGFFDVANERLAYRGGPGTFDNDHGGGWDCTRRGNVIGCKLDLIHSVLAEGVWRERGWDYHPAEKEQARRFDALLAQLWDQMPANQWIALVDYHR